MYGAWESNWILYYHACPVLLIIGIILNEIKKPIGNFFKIMSIGLILISLYEYSRIAVQYDPDFFTFISKFDSYRSVYFFVVLYPALLLILLLIFKKNDSSNKKIFWGNR
jgi:hypothetical protein